MQLLLELKHLYNYLYEHKFISKEPELSDLEKIADECIKDNFGKIECYLIPMLEKEIYDTIKNYIDNIRKISEDEK